MSDRRRVERVNGLLRQEISALVASQLNDPRLRGVITITRVSTASDLRNARVYVSIMGSDRLRKEALEGIRSSASYLRRELRDRISLRYVPFLKFELDDAMLEADRLMRIIDDLHPGEPGPENADSADGANRADGANQPVNPAPRT